MAAPTHHLELSLLPEHFAISRLAGDSPIPQWATKGPFFSVTRTGDELSVVTELSLVPAGVHSQPGWRVLKVQGPFVLSEVGVLAALAKPLAEARISLFAVSTIEEFSVKSRTHSRFFAMAPRKSLSTRLDSPFTE